MFFQKAQYLSRKRSLFWQRDPFRISHGWWWGGNSWPQREIVLNVNTNFLKLGKEEILPFFFRNKMFKIYRANQNRLLFLWETFVTDKMEWHKKCLRLRERESKKFNIQEEHLAVQLEVKIKKIQMWDNPRQACSSHHQIVLDWIVLDLLMIWQTQPINK